MKQAEYLRDELQRLRQIASDEDLKTLAYLLEVAEREAASVLSLRLRLALAQQTRPFHGAVARDAQADQPATPASR